MKLYPLICMCALLANGAWCYGRPYVGSGHPGPRPLLRTSASVSRPVWMTPQRVPSRPYVMYKAPGKGNVRYSQPLPAASKYVAPKSPPWKGPTRTAPSGPAEPLRASASVAHPHRADFPFGGGASYTSITGSGPIHTIPAPNLSLARKPIVVADQSSRQAEYQPIDSQKKPVMKITSYEVTEKFSEPIGASDAYIHPMLLRTLPQSVAFPHHVTLASPELLQLVRNTHQQMPETYGMPIFAQPQVLQPLPQYVSQVNLKNYVQPNLPASPNVLQPNILFKPEPAFIQQIQSQEHKFPGFPQSEHRRPPPESAGQTQIYELDKKEGVIESHKLHYNVVRETNEGSPKVQAFQPSKQIPVFEFITPNRTNEDTTLVKSKDTTIPLKEVKDTIVGANKFKADSVESKLNQKAAELKITKNNTVDVIKPKKNTFEVPKPQPDVKKPKENLVEIKKNKDTTTVSESPKRPHVENDKKNIAAEKVKKSNSKNKDNSIYYSQIGENVDNYVTNGFYAALTEAKAAEALNVETNVLKNSTETNNTKVPPELVSYFVQDSSSKLKETNSEILKPLHGVPFAKPTAETTPEPVTIKLNETLSKNEITSFANLEASESTNIPAISAVNDSINLPNVEKTEIEENVTELPVEKESLRLVLKADTIEPETTQDYSNITVDEKTGEPVIRIYASYKQTNDQKDNTINSIADTNVGGIKTFASSNPNHEDWKSSGGYKSVPGIYFGSGINQISEFGLKLRPKLHELETLIGMEK